MASKSDPAYVWKVEIGYAGGICKRKYYERKEDFLRWFPKHKMNYEPFGYTVKSFILKDNRWLSTEAD